MRRRSRRRRVEDADWQYGGSGHLFPDFSWTNRPDMTGSEAPQRLQDAWVGSFMAIQDVLGAVKDGHCFLINMGRLARLCRIWRAGGAALLLSVDPFMQLRADLRLCTLRPHPRAQL